MKQKQKNASGFVEIDPSVIPVIERAAKIRQDNEDSRWKDWEYNGRPKKLLKFLLENSLRCQNCKTEM